MLGGIDMARPKIAHQQLITAKHIQRQNTVVPVKAVKETTVLFPMHRIVRGIKIQYQLLRRSLERGNKLIEQHLVETNRRVAIGAVLETAQGRGTGQTPIALHRRLQRYVLTQHLIIIEVFIAQRNRIPCDPPQPVDIWYR